MYARAPHAARLPRHIGMLRDAGPAASRHRRRILDDECARSCRTRRSTADVDRDHHHRSRPRRADHVDGDVRPRRDRGPRRAPHRAPAEHPAGDPRLHRVRAARLHLGEHQALPRRPGHPTAEGPARPPHLRHQPPHAARGDRQPADVVGEARPSPGAAHAARRLQRLRRHIDGGEHLARGGRRRRRVHLGRRDLGARARDGPHAGTARRCSASAPTTTARRRRAS